MLTITINERVVDSNYKYLISKGAISNCAFHTENGFLNFLKVANIDLNNYQSRDFQSKENGLVKTYFIDDVTIEDKSFWSESELPENAIKYKGLCNGSYVDCYYTHTAKGSVIFRPNPNAKDVYKPLSLEEHIEYSRVNG